MRGELDGVHHSGIFLAQNLAEVGNCKYSMTNMALDVGIQAIIAEFQEYSERKLRTVNGDIIVGKR